MSNPYSGTNVFEFIALFVQRVIFFATGQLGWKDIAIDEVQIFVLSLVALSAAFVGTFLVLRKMAMLANALSHTLLLGIALAFLILAPSAHSLPLPVLLLAALASALLTSFMTYACKRWFSLSEDVSTGLVFTTLFALGIVIVSGWMRNTHLGIEAIMGNADALHKNDLVFTFWIAMINVLSIILLYRGWKVTTFDPAFAKMSGFSPLFFHMVLLLITAMTAVAAFRAVGVMLALSFFVTPLLCARLLCSRLLTVLCVSAGIGIGSVLLSVALSRHFLTVHGLAFSTGGLTCCCLGAVLFIIWIGKKIREKGWRHAKKYLLDSHKGLPQA